MLNDLNCIFNVSIKYVFCLGLKDLCPLRNGANLGTWQPSLF